MEHKRRWIWIACCLAMAAWLPACAPAGPSLELFCASQLAPAVRRLSPELGRKLGVKVNREVAGSQTLIRLVMDLGRECDLLLLSEAELFKTFASSRVTWRLEFAHDEMVLGVGSRARQADQAERDWAGVLTAPDSVLARVDENLSPVGYRTLLVWRLWEIQGHPGFYYRLYSRNMSLVEHAEQLAAMLKNGDVEYGILYRSTCEAHEIRFIALPPAVNLGQDGQTYDRAEVTYATWVQGRRTLRTVHGGPITCGASIPSQAPHSELAKAALKECFFERQAVWAAAGLSVFQPRFFGTPADHQAIAPWAEYGGDF